MPREVAKLVSGKLSGRPGVAVEPEMVGRSGSDIRVYSEPGFKNYEYGVKPGQSFLDKIRDERPQFVVLQTVCSFITDEQTGSAHADAVTRYCEAIRAAGGEPVFYEMGWGKGDREAEGRRRIFELAVKNRIRLYAPCSTAWARVYRERPELALQHPQDSSHPGDLGHFLNLACFYAALTGESPVGKLPRTYHVWPHALPKPQTDAEESGGRGRTGEIPARRLSGQVGQMDVPQHGRQPHPYTRRADRKVSRNGRVGGVSIGSSATEGDPMIRFTTLILLTALTVAATAMAAPPDAKPRLGINLAGPADWMTELPFVDAFRTARPWISQKKGAGWGQGPELAVDEFGWVKRLEPGCYAEAMLCTISGGHYPAAPTRCSTKAKAKWLSGRTPRSRNERGAHPDQRGCKQGRFLAATPRDQSGQPSPQHSRHHARLRADLG